jgi:hypothetical protein
MSEAFLRIIGKLMTFTTENRDPLHPLHCPPSRNSAVRWVEIPRTATKPLRRRTVSRFSQHPR